MSHARKLGWKPSIRMTLSTATVFVLVFQFPSEHPATSTQLQYSWWSCTQTSLGSSSEPIGTVPLLHHYSLGDSYKYVLYNPCRAHNPNSNPQPCERWANKAASCENTESRDQALMPGRRYQTSSEVVVNPTRSLRLLPGSLRLPPGVTVARWWLKELLKVPLASSCIKINFKVKVFWVFTYVRTNQPTNQQKQKGWEAQASKLDPV